MNKYLKLKELEEKIYKLLIKRQYIKNKQELNNNTKYIKLILDLEKEYLNTLKESEIKEILNILLEYIEDYTLFDKYKLDQFIIERKMYYLLLNELNIKKTEFEKKIDLLKETYEEYFNTILYNLLLEDKKLNTLEITYLNNKLLLDSLNNNVLIFNPNYINLFNDYKESELEEYKKYYVDEFLVEIFRELSNMKESNKISYIYTYYIKALNVILKNKNLIENYKDLIYSLIKKYQFNEDIIYSIDLAYETTNHDIIKYEGLSIEGDKKWIK